MKKRYLIKIIDPFDYKKYPISIDFEELIEVEIKDDAFFTTIELRNDTPQPLYILKNNCIVYSEVLNEKDSKIKQLLHQMRYEIK